LSLRLECPKPPLEGYPVDPETIGEHILKRRLDLGLRQKDVANMIEVSEFTIRNWERGTNEPDVRHIPAIMHFLGYVPFEAGESFHEVMKTYRHVCGLSLKQFAARLDIDPATLSRLEDGISQTKAVLLRLAKYFQVTVDEDEIPDSALCLKHLASLAIREIC